MQLPRTVTVADLTLRPPALAREHARWRCALRARYRLAAVPHGLTFAEIADDVLGHGLASVYTPGHAEWEYWSALRRASSPSPSWSLPLDAPPGTSYLLAAVLGQAVRDLERAMPCTLGLFRRDLGWPWVSDCHCSSRHHSCAAGAAAYL